MQGWLPRGELDEALNASLGAANVHLHNELILCLLHNARCRYLPVELVSQVPASSRGKIVHVPRPPQAPPAALPPASSPSASSPAIPSPPSTTMAALSGTNAAAAGASSSSSSFHGKRTDGLVSNAGEKAATANSGGGRGHAVASSGAASGAAGREESSSKMLPPAPLKIEVGHDGGKGPGAAGVAPVAAAAAVIKPEAKAAPGVTTAPPPPVASDGSFSPGGKRRRVDDGIPPSTATAASTTGQERRRAFALNEDGDGDAILKEAQLLEEEILSHFGPGSDLWHPWSGRGAAAGATGRYGRQHSAGHSNLSRKRPASPDDGPGLTDNGDRQGREVGRKTKALKTELGAAAGGPVANDGSGCSVGELYTSKNSNDETP